MKKTSADYKLMVQTLMEQGRKLNQDLEDMLFADKMVCPRSMEVIAQLDAVNETIGLFLKKFFNAADNISVLMGGMSFKKQIDEYFIEIDVKLGDSPFEKAMKQRKDKSRFSTPKEEEMSGIAEMLGEMLGIDPERLIRVEL
jgi:D-serine deaminase-like pyridoxal phosphate-dependent protein